ncbi:MAG TPA: hypothetical protein VE781_17170, partial [Kineosporiaceae bacterium]|nr:hypothetical protein [Kineosporiaceae bacterium]
SQPVAEPESVTQPESVAESVAEPVAQPVLEPQFRPRLQPVLEPRLLADGEPFAVAEPVTERQPPRLSLALLG